MNDTINEHSFDCMIMYANLRMRQGRKFNDENSLKKQALKLNVDKEIDLSRCISYKRFSKLLD